MSFISFFSFRQTIDFTQYGMDKVLYIGVSQSWSGMYTVIYDCQTNTYPVNQSYTTMTKVTDTSFIINNTGGGGQNRIGGFAVGEGSEGTIILFQY